MADKIAVTLFLIFNMNCPQDAEKKSAKDGEGGEHAHGGRICFITSKNTNKEKKKIKRDREHRKKS